MRKLSLVGGHQLCHLTMAVYFVFLLPKGLRRVRDYGLLRGGAAKLRQRIRLMLAVAGTVFAPLENTTKTQAIRPCPCCRQPMIFMGVHARPTSFFRQKPMTPNATV